MKRGDVVLVAVSGDYGKPRPALIVQSDLFADHPSVSICLVSSHLQPTPLFRYQIEPEPGNGRLLQERLSEGPLLFLEADPPPGGREAKKGVSEKGGGGMHEDRVGMERGEGAQGRGKGPVRCRTNEENVIIVLIWRGDD